MNRDDVIQLANKVNRVTVVPSYGGRITGWDTLTDTCWTPVLKKISTNTCNPLFPEKGGCFPLVPFSNRIAHGHFQFQGKTVLQPAHPVASPHAMHGHGNTSNWTVTRRGSDFVEMSYRHKKDSWPWDYIATQKISIDDNGLECELSVQNLADSDMPVGLGFHPYFANPGNATVYFDAEECWPFGSSMIPEGACTIRDEWSTKHGYAIKGNDLTLGYSGWKQHAKIEWRSPNLSIAIKSSENLDHLILHIPPQADYWCLEPVSHVTDTFNLISKGIKNTGHIVLAPGGFTKATTRFDIERLISSK
ncbi:aldose 1-epimerase [Parasalinivibrio latis]|uniref:aldose 1-epimerase n=1 Tax=Parasalinivibrio latis TaxID=2952610 RepID=UPI0030E43D5A